MGKQINIWHVDDLDGESVADVTRHLAVDGQAYEIDLSQKHSDELDALLKAVLDAARKTGKALPPITYLASGYKGSRTRNDPLELVEARKFAHEHGVLVRGMGRVEKCVMSAYRTNNAKLLQDSRYYVPPVEAAPEPEPQPELEPEPEPKPVKARRSRAKVKADTDVVEAKAG